MMLSPVVRNPLILRGRSSHMAICVCGNINEDVILGVDRFPSFHEKIRASALIRAQGGSAANTAWWLASLGNAVRMVGCVGDDAAGQGAREELRAAGVDTAPVRSSGRATGLAVVMSDGRDKRMVKYDGANADLSVGAHDLAGCRHLHLTSVRERVAADGIRAAQSAGATISWDPSELVHPALLPLVDILFMNEDDYGRSQGDIDRAGVPVTVVALNGGGCCINGTVRIGTIETPVVDTTGAGDAFGAGFLHAYLSGASLEQSGRYAVACSSFNIRKFGAREGFTTREEIETVIAASY